MAPRSRYPARSASIARVESTVPPSRIVMDPKGAGSVAVQAGGVRPHCESRGRVGVGGAEVGPADGDREQAARAAGRCAGRRCGRPAAEAPEVATRGRRRGVQHGGRPARRGRVLDAERAIGRPGGPLAEHADVAPRVASLQVRAGRPRPRIATTSVRAAQPFTNPDGSRCPGGGWRARRSARRWRGAGARSARARPATFGAGPRATASVPAATGPDIARRPVRG